MFTKRVSLNVSTQECVCTGICVVLYSLTRGRRDLCFVLPGTDNPKATWGLCCYHDDTGRFASCRRSVASVVVFGGGQHSGTDGQQDVIGLRDDGQVMSDSSHALLTFDPNGNGIDLYTKIGFHARSNLGKNQPKTVRQRKAMSSRLKNIYANNISQNFCQIISNTIKYHILPVYIYIFIFVYVCCCVYIIC